MKSKNGSLELLGDDGKVAIFWSGQNLGLVANESSKAGDLLTILNEKSDRSEVISIVRDYAPDVFKIAKKFIRSKGKLYHDDGSVFDGQCEKFSMELMDELEKAGYNVHHAYGRYTPRTGFQKGEEFSHHWLEVLGDEYQNSFIVDITAAQFDTIGDEGEFIRMPQQGWLRSINDPRYEEDWDE